MIKWIMISIIIRYFSDEVVLNAELNLLLICIEVFKDGFYVLNTWER